MAILVILVELLFWLDAKAILQGGWSVAALPTRCPILACSRNDFSGLGEI